MIARCRLVSGSFLYGIAKGDVTMAEGKRKRLKSAKELAFRGLGLIIALIVVISLYQLGKQAYDLYLVRKEAVKSSEKIKTIEKDNERLEEERSNLHDPKYVEKVARDEHNMVGKNEVPLFIVDEKKK
jgi:cell division protein DivIC